MTLSYLLRRAASFSAATALMVATSSPSVLAEFTQQQSTVLNNFGVDARSASLADIDRDGDLDLFFQGGTNAQQLFRNNIIGTGSMTYTNVTSTMLVGSGLSSSWSAAWGDYDGDHKIDVFVGQTNSGSATGDVLKNNGAMGFTNTSASTGLNDPGFHQNVAWSDIDGDGDLDFLIGMEGPAERHEIYLQDASHNFTPVGASVGFQADFGTKAYGMAIGDTDGDGDLDVYIATCRLEGNIRNNFFKNMLAETGSLGFVDLNAGANSNGTQNFTNNYGAEFVDLDDDADLDLFVVGADQQPSKIYRNDGGNLFTDVDTLTGHALLSNNGGDLNGARAIDYDNDGDLDLFFHDHLATGGQNNGRLLYRNDGNWQFTNVTTAEGLNTVTQGAYDSAWGDIDLDGDQDLIAPTDGNWNERVFVSDESTNGNHWLYVRLAGLTENTTAIGATLYAMINEGTPEERTLRREANTNAGTFNQSDLPVHFGLGGVTTIDELRIVWPNGTEQILHDVATNQYFTIRIAGDFDGDGDIDAADLARWQGDFGANADSDMDYDGDTDGSDFLSWQRQLGEGGVAASPVNQVVPEPAAAVLAGWSAFCVAACRGRR
jgi:hypothetical protein